MATIDILLATYNGAKFLPEQLRSLSDQTFQDWRLIVRDDGSTDGSLEIVKDWATETGARIRILNDGRKNLGACGNFGALLEASDAPYFALCDQDDVWLPQKLALMLDRLQSTEEQCGQETPLLAHSDLRVVDAELNEIHASFWSYVDIRPPRKDRLLQDLMIENVVTGCASMGNAAMRRISLPISPDAIMHDWWLALAAAALGQLITIPQATILYRQHGSNTLGASKLSLVLLSTRPFQYIERAKTSLAATRRQAVAFYMRYKHLMEKKDAEIAKKYGLISKKPIHERKKFLIKERFLSRNFIRNVAILILT